jgi:hypothetical protein
MVYQGIAEDFLIAKKIPAKASQLPFLSSLWNIGQGANVVQKKKKKGANEVQFNESTVDDITWKFTASGSYSAAATYKARFEGIINSYLPEACGKTGLCQSANFFLGSSSKAVFARSAVSKRGGGQIVARVTFARGSRKPRLIFFPNGGSP